MYPRINYEITENDLKHLLDACKPTPAMMIGNYVPACPQENVNRAWQRLGKKMGFDYMTVMPIPGKGQRFFSAIPTENETQREERIKCETEEKRVAEIKRLEDEIKKLQLQLAELSPVKPS